MQGLHRNHLYCFLQLRFPFFLSSTYFLSLSLQQFQQDSPNNYNSTRVDTRILMQFKIYKIPAAHRMELKVRNVKLITYLQFRISNEF